MCGFDVKRFVDMSERELKHLICLNVFNNAITSDCGHTFCKQCVETLIQNNRNGCPVCRNQFMFASPYILRRVNLGLDRSIILIGSFYFRTNLFVNNMVNDLKIRCDFAPNECQRVTELGLLSSHLKTCEHRLCLNCGFPIKGYVEHQPQICIELLRNEVNKCHKLSGNHSMVSTLAQITELSGIGRISDSWGESWEWESPT